MPTILRCMHQFVQVFPFTAWFKFFASLSICLTQKMQWIFLQMIVLCGVSFGVENQEKEKGSKPTSLNTIAPEEEPPEGYYAFVESPNAEPPKVRPPPYIDSDKECHGK